MWVELTYRAACAEAHALAEQQTLRNLALNVEEEFCRRYRRGRQQLDQMLEWETALVHVAPETPPERCLICRKARLDIPIGLPLPTLGRTS